jgi:hypothetical protein
MFNWIVGRNILSYVLIVLLAASITCGAGWHLTKNQLKVERAERKNDKLAYEKAQADATAKALQEKIEKEREYAKIKEEQDIAYSKLLNEYRSAVVRYKAAQGSARKTYLPSNSSSPSVDAGTSTSPLVPVPEDDLLICATNTAKAQIAHEWAKSLQENNQ